MPDLDQSLKRGDILLIQGRPEDIDVLRGLQELEVTAKNQPNLTVFESDRLGLLEATLNPRSSLVGKPVSELAFRERYDLELVAIWRKGRAIRHNLDQHVLQFGDALLLLGPRDKLRVLDDDPDFLALTPVGQQPADTKRAPLAATIMLGVVAAVLTGWLPIFIAAVIGATLMVLSRCLTMEQAYRAIDWQAIFLIAGMLPLGTAMQDTGGGGLCGRRNHGLARRFGSVVGHRRPLHHHRHGNDDHSHRRTGGFDVSHRVVSKR